MSELQIGDRVQAGEVYLIQNSTEVQNKENKEFSIKTFIFKSDNLTFQLLEKNILTPLKRLASNTPFWELNLHSLTCAELHHTSISQNYLSGENTGIMNCSIATI